MRRIAFLALLVAAPVSAATLTEQYALQERCGKRAEEVFTRDWGRSGTKDGVWASYRNHYNTKLNKCFYLFTSTSPKLMQETLFDVNESRAYGVLTVSYSNNKRSCEMLGKECAPDDWEKLIQPYMED